MILKIHNHTTGQVWTSPESTVMVVVEPAVTKSVDIAPVEEEVELTAERIEIKESIGAHLFKMGDEL